MDERIAFVEGERIGLVCQGSTAYFHSDYLKKYRENVRSIKDRNVWKNEGVTSAAFASESAMLQPEQLVTSINGVAFVDRDGRIAYSASSSDYSGVYIKHTQGDNNAEGHVVHHARLEFAGLDYSPARREMAVSVRMGDTERHIAMLDMDSGSIKSLTEGDSVDENPSWGRYDGSRLYYNSSGIGKDAAGNYSGIGPSAVLCLDLNRREIEEAAYIGGQDCILPKEDVRGNLYFIKRPHGGAGGRMSFVDILSIPYKLLRGVFHFLEFFTARFTGETFNSRGANPARAMQPDRKGIFIHGNLINAEKTLKENTKRGEKYPGVAPASWQLMRKDRDGKIEVVKKGVLDYDIAGNGDIVYSNGRYIVRLTDEGAEEKIEKVDMAVKVRVCG